MIDVTMLHSVIIGALVADVLLLRRQVTALKNPPRPPCEICGQPGSFVKITADSTGSQHVRLCSDCFGESIAADFRECVEDDE